MRITDLLDRRSVSLTAAPKTKSETLDMAVDLMVKSEKISNREAYRKQVYLREEESTTGIGEGIAIPHGKCDAVKKPGLAAMVIKNGVEFEALDDEPVTLLFLIAAPNTEDNIHLDVLSKLSVMLMDEEFTESLRNASSVDEFMDIIDRADSEKKDIDERLADTGSAEGTQAKILAVTSCPTGIAHTYMAAEGIEKAAKAKNCFVKIETRGSGGAKNVLTDQEIADADCIIVAADAKVPMERFDGKKVIECQVSDGISKADQLIDRAINGDAPVYHAAAGSQTSSAGNKSGGSVGHKIYMQLMNGVSHMLPLVVGGGILIALAFLIDGLSVDLSSLPADQRANFGTITPVAAVLKNIGGTAFGFMLPVLAGFIAMAIGDRPALAVGLVGGMIAANGKSGFLGALLAGFLAGYLILGLRKVCDEKDILLIFDEIQCGMGRCGSLFAHDLYGVKPDVLTLAKALGCGVPVGAFVVGEKADGALVPGDHGTTYGGNPFAAAAINAVFDQFEKLQVPEHAKEIGTYLWDKLEELKEKHDCITGHRGIALMQGLEFNADHPVGDIVKKALEKGLIIISAGNNVIRFVPPLVIEKEHVDEMISILEDCIA